MSRDPSFIPGFPHIPNFPAYNNNSFNTTGSLNNNTNSLKNNSNCFNTNNINVTDGRSEILTWLSPLEPHSRHYSVQTRRVNNVGDWLLHTEQFQCWRSGDSLGDRQNLVMFCYGNPGVGKTFISSLVIDALCDEAGQEDIAVACFYFDFGSQMEQTAASVLGALLKQVVGGFKKIPGAIMDGFQKQKKVIGSRRLQLPEVVKLLASLSSLRRTFFCLDTLDECAAADRAKILLSLHDIIGISPTTRVFMTGRPNVTSEVGSRLPGSLVIVSISPRKDDIIRYIHTRLVEDTTSDEMDERLKAEIVRKFLETASEMFLLVSLKLDAILQETTIYRRRKRLRAMTEGLDLGDAYTATLYRIKAQDGRRARFGMAALMWICHSERPLGTEELCQALAIEIGSIDFDPENTPSIRTVLSCCQRLVAVDKEGRIVRLIHYTLQQYLTSHPNFFRNPHSTIAEICLTYLNSKQVMALSTSQFWSTPSTPFLQYSALYWGTHMKKEFSHRGRTLALGLFCHYERHVSIRPLLEHTVGQYSLYSSVDIDKFTGLHAAAILGLVEVARALIAMDSVDINCTDDTDATPLTWAARAGHGGVVELLLGQEDISPDRPDDDG